MQEEQGHAGTAGPGTALGGLKMGATSIQQERNTNHSHRQRAKGLVTKQHGIREEGEDLRN